MPIVDLVSSQTTRTDTGPAAVFKCCWHEQFVERQWDELKLWVRVPGHPNIAPFNRIVLDEVRGGVEGFTSLFIPGGTLQDNVCRPSEFKWAEQLMQVVDDLNMRYDIVHQVSSLAACWATKPRTTSCCTSSTRLRRLVVLADPSFWITEVSISIR